MITLLTSATGAPGVTTTALGLTLAWPRPALLVDADRDAPQAILAGYLKGIDPQNRGLPALAQAHREARALDVIGQCLPLPPTYEHAFLPGFSNPAQESVFASVWPPLAHAFAAVGASERDVIIDVGRIRTGLPSALVRSADRIVIVARSNLQSLAPLRYHLDGLLEQSERDDAIQFLIVGPDRPYSLKEIRKQFPVAVTSIPWDPFAATNLNDGADLAKDRRESQLLKAWRSLAEKLVADHDKQRAELWGKR
ncbi:MAG: hypothetical protein ACRDAX_04125 [Propionibacteriaceae bacterium]